MTEDGVGADPEFEQLSRRQLIASALSVGSLVGSAGCQATGDQSSLTTPESGSGDDPTVTLWHQETQIERREAMVDIAEQFERNHGWDLDVEAIKSQAIHVEYQLRKAEDAFTLAQFNTSQLDLVRGTDRPAVETARETVESIGADRFWDNVLKQAEVEDGYLGVPLFVWVQGPWYRQSAFEEYGISEPPRSWDQLHDTAQTLHEPDSDQYGIVIGEGSETEYATHCYTQLALSNDVPLFSEDGDILFDSDDHIETLEFYRQLAEYTPPETIKPVSAFNAFVDGRAHFGIYPTHLITYVWDQAENPQAAVGDLRFAGFMDETRKSAYGLMNYLVFSAAATQGELAGAQAFTEFLLADDDHQHYMDWLSVQIGGFQPVFEDFHGRDAYKNNEILTHVDDEIIHDLVPEGIASIERFGGMVHDEYFPVIGEIEGKFLISKAIRRVLEGENAKQVAEDVADRMRELRE